MQLANAKEQQQRWPAQVLSTAHTCSNVWRPCCGIETPIQEMAAQQSQTKNQGPRASLTCSNVWRPMSLSVSGDTMMACLHRTAEQQLFSSWGGATSSANMPSLLRQHAQRPLPITLHVSLCTRIVHHPPPAKQPHCWALTRALRRAPPAHQSTSSAPTAAHSHAPCVRHLLPAADPDHSAASAQHRHPAQRALAGFLGVDHCVAALAAPAEMLVPPAGGLEVGEVGSKKNECGGISELLVCKLVANMEETAEVGNEAVLQLVWYTPSTARLAACHPSHH